jgi:hypothetical protein
MTFGCTRHQQRDASAEHFLVCGTLTNDGKAVSNALIQLHKQQKDTSDDPKANSFEVAVTEQDGKFHLGSAVANREYWIALAGVHSCTFPSAPYESQRIPVVFHRSAGAVDCEAEVHIVVSDCSPKLE